MFVCCECFVLSGRGVCDELITRPEESYRLWCVVVCHLETSGMGRSWPALSRCATGRGRSYEISIAPIKEVPKLFLIKHYSFNLKNKFHNNHYRNVLKHLPGTGRGSLWILTAYSENRCSASFRKVLQISVSSSQVNEICLFLRETSCNRETLC